MIVAESEISRNRGVSHSQSLIHVIEPAYCKLPVRPGAGLRISSRPTHGHRSRPKLIEACHSSGLTHVKGTVVAELDSRVIEICNLGATLQRRLFRSEFRRLNLQNIRQEAELHVGLRG